MYLYTVYSIPTLCMMNQQIKIKVNDQLAMSFVHECNKNNRKYTKRNEFAWHSKILTNPLRFICLFFNINNLSKTYEDF